MQQVQHTNPDGSVVTIWCGERAVIGERATIGERAMIGGWATIGEWAAIGEWATIGEWAVIGERATIGGRARRHAVRCDGYVFTVGTRDGEARIFAGCRDFNEVEAREHWGPAHKQHAETTVILDFLFR